MDPRFRPTLWPGTVVPTPPLRGLRGVEVRGDWITWPIAAREETPTRLPEDFYLRELLEVQPDDLEGVAALMRSYGLLFDLNLCKLDLINFDPDTAAALRAIPDYRDQEVPDDPFLKGYRTGVHRELVSLHLQTAHEAIKVWLAC